QAPRMSDPRRSRAVSRRPPMSILDKNPWIQEHLDLYRKDPDKGHDFRPGDRDFSTPSLILTTTGRKSGEKRSLPLIYGRSGSNFVIVASLGGAPDHPMWYKNLVANPEAEIQVRHDHHKVRARDAHGAERETLWKMMAAI